MSQKSWDRCGRCWLLESVPGLLRHILFARRIWTFPYISGLGEDLAGDGGDGAALGGVRAAGPVSSGWAVSDILMKPIFRMLPKTG